MRILKVLHLGLSWRLAVQASWPSTWPLPLGCLQDTTLIMILDKIHTMLDIINILYFINLSDSKRADLSKYYGNNFSSSIDSESTRKE